MRIFWVVLLFIVVRETKSQSLVPSDAPCSEAPYSEPPTLVDGCQDKHGDVVGNLLTAFGEENCSTLDKPGVDGGLHCIHDILSEGYTAEADYKYNLTGCVEHPYSLQVTITNNTTSSLTLFDFVTNCIDVSLLDSIQSKRENQSLVPTEAPCSEVPTFEIPNDWCQDTDEEVVDRLLTVFGEENCSELTENDLSPIDDIVGDDGGDGGLFCAFDVPEYFASTEYRYRVNGCVKRPIYLNMMEGPNTKTYSTTFNMKADCFKDFDMSFEWIHRGRICTNPLGDIDYTNRIGVDKTRTCKEIGEGKSIRLRKLCRRFSEISKTCKGICQIGNFCRCQDNPFEFIYKDGTTTCRALLEMDSNKRDKRCAKTKFKTHCPRVCDSCELSGSPDEFDNVVI